MSPCNCGKKASNLKYLFTAPDGSSKVYNTEIEARAAKIRAGGGTITTKAA